MIPRLQQPLKLPADVTMPPFSSAESACFIGALLANALST
jgi:hypothetical protein